VTDLGGTRQEIGGSFAYNRAALLDSYRSDTRSANGGTRVATLEVTWEKEDEDTQEDTVKLEDLEEMPVEGARPEEIATGKIVPPE